MRIGLRLVLGFMSIVLLVVLIGYISSNTSQRALQKSIEENTLSLAVETLDKIDRDIYSKIENLLDYTTDLTLQETILESNQRFEELSDVLTYINKKDKEWTSVPKKEVTPLMQEIMDNKLSEELRKKIELYENNSGYKLFGEIFITNKYGANVAQTGKTTDYKQNDEEWWQEAKEDGLFIRDVEYDESADVYSTDIGIRIDDKNGNLIGMMKAVLNIAEVINIIKELETNVIHKGRKTMEYNLITKEGRLICSTKNFKYLENVSNLLPELRHVEGGNTGQYIRKNEHGGELVVYARSRGYKKYKGLGWIFLVEHKTGEIFAPVNDLRKRILIMSLVVIIFAISMSFFISSSIARPIARLGDSMREVRRGNLDVQIDVKSKDEIGILADSFNKMTEDLRQTTISKDHVNNIFNGMRESLIVMTPEGMIQTVNQATCKLLGYKENELIGKPIEMIYGKEGQLETININDIIKKGNVQNIEITYLSGGGKNIPMLFSGTVMSSNDSGIKGIICVAQDITEQKRAEDQILKLSQAIEQGPTTVMITDIKGNIEYVNPRFTETTGYSPEEAIGKNPRILKSGEHAPEVYKKLWDTICSGGEWRGELHNKRKNGELYWELTSISPVRNREDIITHFIAVKEDITERKRLEQLQKNTMEEREQTIESLKNLMDFSAIMREEIQEAELIRHLAHALKKYFKPDVLVVLMLNREKDVLDVSLIEPQMPVDKLIKSEAFVNPSICRVLRTGHELIVRDINKDISCECISLKIKEGGYACYPLITGGITTGAVLLVNRETGYWDSEAKQSLFSTYIGLAASSLHSVRLMDMTRRAAVTDGLTGAYNRRFFDETLEKQILLAKRRKVSLSLLIMDIDHFKDFNDTYGHIAGDNVLKQLTTSVSNSIRDSDILARYGGEEFVIIMPDAGLSSALEKANEVRQNVESMNLDNIVSGQTLKMTISIGVASFPEHGAEFSTLVASADSALYKAKEGGRNRVEAP